MPEPRRNLGQYSFKETGSPIHDYSTGEMPADDVPTWTTREMTRDFETIRFNAPFVIVRRRSDGQQGTLQFNHRPRIYWGFDPDGGADQ